MSIGVGDDGLGGDEDCIETERSSRQSIMERTSLFADDTTASSSSIIVFADDVTAEEVTSGLTICDEDLCFRG